MFWESVSCVLALSLVTVACASPLLSGDLPVEWVRRFGDHSPMCEENQVCADLFNTTRYGQRYIRVLENCRCPSSEVPCGYNPEALVFRETQMHSQLTCEEETNYDECTPDEDAKEEITGGDFLSNYVLHIIKCICPHNEEPLNFRNRMTKTWRGHGPIRTFRCRDRS